MVLIENVFGHFNIISVLAEFAPREAYNPIDIVSYHGRLSGHGRHHFQLFKLTSGLFLSLFAHGLTSYLLFNCI